MGDRIDTLLFCGMVLAGCAVCASMVLLGCATGTPVGNGATSDAGLGQADANSNSADATEQQQYPDAAGVCPTAPCDLVNQCGCDAPAVCDLDTANIGATSCRSVTVAGTEESACTSLSACAGGYVCVSGGCSKFCNVDTDCGNPRRKCVVTLSTGGTPVPNATTCSSACEPPNAAAGGCPPGHGCRLSFYDADGDPENGNEIVYAMCGPAGSSGQGEACTRNSDCAVNLLCLNSGGLKCARMCTLSPVGGECTSGTCTGLIPTMVIGGVAYGACL